jgi:hypothetical protein
MTFSRRPADCSRASYSLRPLLAAICVLVLGATLWSQTGVEPARCAATVQLVDSSTGERLAGLVQITDADGNRLPLPELLSRGQGLRQPAIQKWSVVPATGAIKVSLPKQSLTLTALSGLETELASLKLDLRNKSEETVHVPLKRFYKAGAQGLRGANTHLHLQRLTREQSDRYLTEIPAGDALDLLFVSYLERAGADHEYITNKYSRADLARIAEAARLAFGDGQEHRHNFLAQGEKLGLAQLEGYGHVMLLNIRQLVQPVSIGKGITADGTDGLPLQRGIETARRDGGTAIWCHNHWGLELVPNWVLGRLDAQNIFDAGDHGGYDVTFYRFLNAGMRVPFSTGTDWFINDFSRVYVPLAEPLTPQAWLKSLSAGRGYITNGTFLEFSVNGQSAGDTIKLSGSGTVEVTARGLGRNDFKQLELVHGGHVIQAAPSRSVEGHFEASARWTVSIPRSGWLALRTPQPVLRPDSNLVMPRRDIAGARADGVAAAATPAATGQNELGNALFSHTSPVYVEVGGKPIFEPAAARDLLAEIERAIRYITEKGEFADDVERARVLDVYRDAIAELRRKVDK